LKKVDKMKTSYKDTSGDHLTISTRICTKHATGMAIKALNLDFKIARLDNLEFESTRKIRQIAQALIAAASEIERFNRGQNKKTKRLYRRPH
jgi:hypothetical protein